MSDELSDSHGDGIVALSRSGWWAVMAALEGDESQREAAFDALQRWAPRQWIEALELHEERMRAAQPAHDHPM